MLTFGAEIFVREIFIVYEHKKFFVMGFDTAAISFPIQVE